MPLLRQAGAKVCAQSHRSDPAGCRADTRKVRPYATARALFIDGPLRNVLVQSPECLAVLAQRNPIQIPGFQTSPVFIEFRQPRSVPVFLMSLAYFMDGQFAEAAAAAKKSLNQNPRSTLALRLAGLPQ